MQVEWATVIEEFRQDPEGRDVAVGIGAETSPVDQFPGSVRVLVLAFLRADYDELGAKVEKTGWPVQHRIHWEVRYPSGALATAVDEPPFGALPPNPWHHPGQPGHLSWPLKVEFTASTEGTYEIQVQVDGTEPWTIQHYVVALTDLLRGGDATTSN